MSFKRCPGSAAFSQPRIELVTCRHCGGQAEVWSDEATGTCASCGTTVMRTATQSCLDWCKYASDCLGEEKYKQYQNLKAAVRKEALVAAAADRFAWGQRRQKSVWNLIERAEEQLHRHPDADPNAVLAAAVLHVGMNGSAAETPPPDRVNTVTRELLDRLDYPRGFVERVCEILQAVTADASGDPDVAVLRSALGT